jgi:hypothetical protein
MNNQYLGDPDDFEIIIDDENNGATFDDNVFIEDILNNNYVLVVGNEGVLNTEIRNGQFKKYHGDMRQMMLRLINASEFKNPDRFEDFSQMTVFFHSFFGLGETFTDFASQAAVMDKFWLFLFAIVLCMPVRKLIADITDRLLKNHRILNHGAILVGRTVLSLVVLILSVALLVGATNNAFLYTRF